MRTTDSWSSVRSPRLGPLAAAALVVGLCTVSACTPTSLRELTQRAGGVVEAAAAVMGPSRGASGDPLLEFLAGAEDGEVRDLDDQSTGARLRVTAGRVYHAASGRLCRRYTAGSAAAAPENQEKGLACEAANGYWDRVGLLAPVSH